MLKITYTKQIYFYINFTKKVDRLQFCQNIMLGCFRKIFFDQLKVNGFFLTPNHIHNHFNDDNLSFEIYYNQINNHQEKALEELIKDIIKNWNKLLKEEDFKIHKTLMLRILTKCAENKTERAKWDEEYNNDCAKSYCDPVHYKKVIKELSFDEFSTYSQDMMDGAKIQNT